DRVSTTADGPTGRADQGETRSAEVTVDGGGVVVVLPSQLVAVAVYLVDPHADEVAAVHGTGRLGHDSQDGLVGVGGRAGEGADPRTFTGGVGHRHPVDERNSRFDGSEHEDEQEGNDQCGLNQGRSALSE